MELTEKRINGERRYSGIIVNVRLDRAELSNGSTVKREVVEHPGGVTVLPVDGDGNCYMVRQFRYPFSRTMLEAPAGILEPGEEPTAAAARELSEETGFTADELVDLGSCCASPGYLTETIRIYLALGLHAGMSHPDADELLFVEKHGLDELIGRAMKNEIEDSKTMIALFKAEKYLKSRKYSD